MGTVNLLNFIEFVIVYSLKEKSSKCHILQGHGKQWPFLTSITGRRGEPLRQSLSRQGKGPADEIFWDIVICLFSNEINLKKLQLNYAWVPKDYYPTSKNSTCFCLSSQQVKQYLSIRPIHTAGCLYYLFSGMEEGQWIK